MKILPIADYHKVLEPLKQISINHLFAKSVVEQNVNGKIYVDNTYTPGTFYVVHPYGMSLLFGANDNILFNEWFKTHSLNVYNERGTHEWMQAFPGHWNETLQNLYKDRLILSAYTNGAPARGTVELNTRVNFRFNQAAYLNNRKTGLATEIKITQTDRKAFKEMKGSVVPFYFWNSEDDFINNGIGFSLFYNNQLASTAYSAYIHDNLLEIGIETIAEFRGKGFAEQTCSALIDHCIENNLEPVWSCRLENTASYKLAQKLSFEPSVTVPYYRLSN